MPNYIRISEAAKRLGVTRAGMYHIIDNLALPTVTIMGITAIDEYWLDTDAVKNRRTPTKKGLNKTRLTSVK